MSRSRQGVATLRTKYDILFEGVVPDIEAFLDELEKRRKQPYHERKLFKKEPLNIRRENTDDMRSCMGLFDKHMEDAKGRLRILLRDAGKPVADEPAEFAEDARDYLTYILRGFDLLDRLPTRCTDKFTRIDKLLTKPFGKEGVHFKSEDFKKLLEKIRAVKRRIDATLEERRIHREAKKIIENVSREVFSLPKPPTHSPRGGGTRRRRRGGRAAKGTRRQKR